MSTIDNVKQIWYNIYSDYTKERNSWKNNLILLQLNYAFGKEEKTMDKKRYKSVIALWGIIFICLQAITIVNVFGINPGGYTEVAKAINSITAVIIVVLTIIFMVLSLKFKKSGPIIGMIIGAVYIVASFNVGYMIVGILFIFSCADLLQELNKGQNDKETKKVEEKIEK